MEVLEVTKAVKTRTDNMDRAIADPSTYEVETLPSNEEKYLQISEGEEIGYYKSSLSGNPTRLTNFIIDFDEFIKSDKDNQPWSVFNGKLLLSDGSIIPFKNLSSNHLTEPKNLEVYCTNLAGPKIQFYEDKTRILQSIKYFNKDVPMHQAQDFGYDPDLSEYVSEKLVITRDNINEKYTPIKHQVSWDGKELTFAKSEYDVLIEIKKSIISNLMTFDDPEVVYSAIAFGALPLVHPFIRSVMPNRPYLMLKGPSGSGKTFLATMIQRLFGKYHNLTGWSSTDASLMILGHSHKDAIFAVDDFKAQNFPSEYDRRKAMRTIQNYYDNYARNRANINMNLRDELKIRGFLLISAEDLVFTEASTIARGIIIEMKSKVPDFTKADNMEFESKKFHHLTAYFIQHMLRVTSIQNPEDLFNDSRKRIYDLVNNMDFNASNDNLPRIVNNFALLLTGWEYILDFLVSDLEDSKMLKTNMNQIFLSSLESLLKSNLKRVQTYKPEVKFVETLWQLVEKGVLSFQDLDHKDVYLQGKKIGWYKLLPQDKNKYTTSNRHSSFIKIALDLVDAYKEVNNYLLSEGGIGVTRETLLSKLVSDNNILVNNGGRVSFGNDKVRGVEWIGDFPHELFGLIAKEPIEREEDEIDSIFDFKQKKEDRIDEQNNDSYSSGILELR